VFQAKNQFFINISYFTKRVELSKVSQFYLIVKYFTLGVMNRSFLKYSMHMIVDRGF